jgi:hypothetical protein
MFISAKRRIATAMPSGSSPGRGMSVGAPFASCAVQPPVGARRASLILASDGRLIGAAAEIDDDLNRGRNTRTPEAACAT